MRSLGNLGWGIVIYAILFLAWSGFVMYGFTEGVVPRLAGLFVLISISFIAARALRAYSWKDVLPYSIAWVIEIILLDIALSVPYTGWALFSDWNVWVGYTLVLLVPLFAPYVQSRIHAGDIVH